MNFGFGNSDSEDEGNDKGKSRQEIKQERDEAKEKLQELQSELEEKKEEKKELEMSVGHLATVIKANAEGDLNETPPDPDCESAERVYNAYNSLLDELRDTVDRMKSFSDQVSSSTEQVDMTIGSVKQASREVSGEVEDISEDSDHQKEEIKTISEEMRSLSATIQQIAASADEVADITNDAAEKGFSAQESANEAMDELETLTKRAQEAVENVEELNNLLGDIEEIVEFITDIADKTNILALNANVEAARAGEAGEGFTVVADEVKNLATDTKEATEEIESSIRKIHDQAAETVGEMHETRDTVDKTHDTVQDALDQLDTVVDHVENVDSSVQEIDGATDQQAESTEEVVDKVDEVGDISIRTADKADKAAEAAHQQTTELSEVSTRVATLTERAESLEDTLDEFDVSRDRAASDADETVVEFWHAMGGEKAILLQNLANEFEETHDDIKIKLSSKGSYRGTLEATLRAARNGQPPAIAQIFEIGTTRARESGFFRPVGGLVSESHIDSLVDQVKSYYRFGGKQYSIPFNSSNPVLAYNKEIFEQVDGLDAREPPQTFEEVREAANKIVSQDHSDYGITFANYSWFVEQWFGEANEPLVNNENGREGTPTETNLNGEFAQDLVEWWKGMESESVYYDPGIENRGEAKNKFHARDSAMLIGSTSSLRGIESGADFEVGTGMFPVRDNRTGVLVGGASLWVGADLPEEVHEAVAEFLEWLTSPEQQKRWHKETGYFPVHEQAIDQLESEGWFQENPFFRIAFDQLQNTEDTVATRGAQIGPFDTIRTMIEDSIDSIDSVDQVTETLDRLDSQVQKQLQSYESDE